MSTDPINIPASPYYNLDGCEIYYEIIDSDGRTTGGDTIDEVFSKFSKIYSSRIAYDNPPKFQDFEVRVIIIPTANSELIYARVRELLAERKAKEAAAQLQQSLEFYNILLDAWQKRVDALNAEAGDYTPEGFNKRWKALQDQKPVKP